MSRQRTIKKAVEGSGIGLHSGNRVDIRLVPAPANHGVVFRRIDLSPTVDIPASAALVNDTQLCTALAQDGVRVATIEHLMSALAGLGVDNILIELNAPEVPIMDGSAAPFVFLLQQAGIKELDMSKKFIEVTSPIEVREGDKWARVLPFKGFRLDFSIEFEHPVFRHRSRHFRLDFSSDEYVRHISRARTFGFLRDIEFLQSHGLALGGSLENAVVIDDYRVMNENGLRYVDEFVRHKMLDAIGDMYLVGSPILGWYQGYKSGHDMNNKLCLAMLAQTDSWRYTTMDQAQDRSVDFAYSDDFNGNAQLAH